MILVVGGTGTIGSEVVRLLKAQDVPFRILVRDPVKAETLKAQGADTVVADLRAPETLPGALQGIGKVFVVTPLVPDQVQMRAALIAAAKAARVRHVVMSTGIGAAPDSPVQIGRWHGENQQQLQGSGMTWTFVQPGFFMQNLLMGVVPLAVERWPVTAPWRTCYAAFSTAPRSLSGRRASKAFRSPRIWPQPRSLRMRVAASLSALATQRSTICPSPQRLTLRA